MLQAQWRTNVNLQWTYQWQKCELGEAGTECPAQSWEWGGIRKSPQGEQVCDLGRDFQGEELAQAEVWELKIIVQGPELTWFSPGVLGTKARQQFQVEAGFIHQDSALSWRHRYSAWPHSLPFFPFSLPLFFHPFSLFSRLSLPPPALLTYLGTSFD